MYLREIKTSVIHTASPKFPNIKHTTACEEDLVKNGNAMLFLAVDLEVVDADPAMVTCMVCTWMACARVHS